MNVVIYTKDFEPITVLDLPLWLMEQMEKVGSARVAVLEPPVFNNNDAKQDFIANKVVTIRCEKLRWHDKTLKSILITDDEELALLLTPEWLPGQRQAINDYKQTIRLLTHQLAKALRK